VEKAKRRTTSPGLGDAPASSTRAASGDEPRAPKISTRRARSSRPPVRVDDVGEAAVALARRVSRPPASAPRMLLSRGELAALPLDPRDAFVLSLVDGKTSVQGLVDMAALGDGEVLTILERLAALRVLELP
jgi:hypothetical protein